MNKSSNAIVIVIGLAAVAIGYVRAHRPATEEQFEACYRPRYQLQVAMHPGTWHPGPGDPADAAIVPDVDRCMATFGFEVKAPCPERISTCYAPS